MLKVRGAEYTIACIARAKNFIPHPLCTIEAEGTISQGFFDERTNGKWSRVDLAAIYSHIDS